MPPFCPPKREYNAVSAERLTKFGNIVRVGTSRYLTKITTLRRKAARSNVLVAKRTASLQLLYSWWQPGEIGCAYRICNSLKGGGVKLVVHITVCKGSFGPYLGARLGALRAAQASLRLALGTSLYCKLLGLAALLIGSSPYDAIVPKFAPPYFLILYLTTYFHCLFPLPITNYKRYLQWQLWIIVVIFLLSPRV